MLYAIGPQQLPTLPVPSHTRPDSPCCVSLIEALEMDLLILKNDHLRRAIRRNQVSFPAGAPVFPRQSRPDIAWRLALLYFIRGWSMNDLALRYQLSRERAGQIVKGWRSLAIQSGYIQEIPEDPRKTPL
jgi:hypothetical protein